MAFIYYMPERFIKAVNAEKNNESFLSADFDIIQKNTN
jgi:hypothetical protein